MFLNCANKNKMKANKLFEVDLEKYPDGEFFNIVNKKIKMEKGQYILINIKNNGLSAIIACPRCGAKRPLKKRVGNKGHLVTFNNKGQISVSPSINNADGGCCNYHDFLENDIFRNV